LGDETNGAICAHSLQGHLRKDRFFGCFKRKMNVSGEFCRKA
jgi:hypothetical protein